MKNDKDIPKQSGFAAPDGYLDDLEDRLMEHAATTLPEETGFVVPDGYFDGLEEQIMQRLKPEVAVVPISAGAKWVKLRWAVSAIAACLVGFLLWNQGSEPEADWPDAAEMLSYLEEEAMDLSDDDLLGYLNEGELEELLQTPMAEEDELELYLIDHLDDTELLIELQQ